MKESTCCDAGQQTSQQRVISIEKDRTPDAPDQTARKPHAPDQTAGKLHARSDSDGAARPRLGGHEGAHARSEIHHAPRSGQKATTPEAPDKRPTKLQRRDRKATSRHRPDQTAMKPQRADPQCLTRDDPIKGQAVSLSWPVHGQSLLRFCQSSRRTFDLPRRCQSSGES
jgi:hypothetical protein